MAKQNVTFVERHVEKIVVGIAGAALLVIAGLYLINTPHTVEMDGENLGPERLYAQLRDQAEQARNRMKNAQPEQNVPDGGGPIGIADSDAQRSPYDYLNIPKEIAGTFVPLGPDVPDVGFGPVRGQVRLADILPPKPVLVTTGRAFVKLSDPQTIIPGERSTGSEIPQLGVTKDYHWVTVVAAVHRKEQGEQFNKAHYELNRQRLIVAAVEAERQQRMPDGEWGEPVLVSGYSPRVIPVLRHVELVKQDDGDYVIYEGDSDNIAAYRTLLETREGQAMVLRPAFQEFLEYPYDWVCPAQLPEVDIKLADYEVLLPPDEESDETELKTYGGDRIRPTLGGDADRTGRAQINKLSKEAEEAISKAEYIEAGELLNQIITSPDATQKQIESAQSELRRIQPNIDKELIKKQREEQKLSQEAQQQLGEDIEPLWLNDLSVTPGAMYRYRLRLLAYNPYVGFAPKLENPEDAGKVVTIGQWSEWSEPIQVAPALHLFLASAKEKPKQAKLEMREWVLGDWHIGSRDIGVGEPIAFNAGRHDFTYNAVVVDIVDGVNFPERSVNRTGEISYREKPTATIVLLTSSGDVEERIAAVDSNRKRNLVADIKEDKKRRSEYQGTDHRQPRERHLPQPLGRPSLDDRRHEESEDNLLPLLR